MKRIFLKGTLALAFTSLAMTSVAQDAYPNRPITLIVPSSAGGFCIPVDQARFELSTSD